MIDRDTGIRIEQCLKCKGQNQFGSLSSSLVLGTLMVRFFPNLKFDYLKNVNWTWLTKNMNVRGTRLNIVFQQNLLL